MDYNLSIDAIESLSLERKDPGGHFLTDSISNASADRVGVQNEASECHISQTSTNVGTLVLETEISDRANDDTAPPLSCPCSDNDDQVSNRVPSVNSQYSSFQEGAAQLEKVSFYAENLLDSLDSLRTRLTSLLSEYHERKKLLDYLKRQLAKTQHFCRVLRYHMQQIVLEKHHTQSLMRDPVNSDAYQNAHKALEQTLQRISNYDNKQKSDSQLNTAVSSSKDSSEKIATLSSQDAETSSSMNMPRLHGSDPNSKKVKLLIHQLHDIHNALVTHAGLRLSSFLKARVSRQQNDAFESSSSDNFLGEHRFLVLLLGKLNYASLSETLQHYASFQCAKYREVFHKYAIFLLAASLEYEKEISDSERKSHNLFEKSALLQGADPVAHSVSYVVSHLRYQPLLESLSYSDILDYRTNSKRLTHFETIFQCLVNLLLDLTHYEYHCLTSLTSVIESVEPYLSVMFDPILTELCKIHNIWVDSTDDYIALLHVIRCIEKTMANPSMKIFNASIWKVMHKNSCETLFTVFQGQTESLRSIREETSLEIPWHRVSVLPSTARYAEFTASLLRFCILFRETKCRTSVQDTYVSSDNNLQNCNHITANVDKKPLHHDSCTTGTSSKQTEMNCLGSRVGTESIFVDSSVRLRSQVAFTYAPAALEFPLHDSLSAFVSYAWSIFEQFIIFVSRLIPTERSVERWLLNNYYHVVLVYKERGIPQWREQYPILKQLDDRVRLYQEHLMEDCLNKFSITSETHLEMNGDKL